MGDEISLSVPNDPSAAQVSFVAWCAANHVAVPGQYNVSWDADGVENTKLFYYSKLYANSFGLDAMAAATALLRKCRLHPSFYIMSGPDDCLESMSFE